LRLVACAFLVLATAVTVGAIGALVTGAIPDESPIRIAYMATTAIAMLSLGAAKRATGRRLENEPLAADVRRFIDHVRWQSEDNARGGSGCNSGFGMLRDDRERLS
jgi:hypothetical protein